MKRYVDGRPVCESTGEEKERKAHRFLKQREERAAAGLAALPRADRARSEEGMKNLRVHYEATGSRDPNEAGKRLQHLDAPFLGRRS